VFGERLVPRDRASTVFHRRRIRCRAPRCVTKHRLAHLLHEPQHLQQLVRQEESMTSDVSRLSRKRLRDCRGNTLVEAAVLTPLLLLLTFSIMDFASLFYVYLALENGVSQASRYGVTGNLMDDPASAGKKLTHTGSIIAAMRNATPTLTIDDGKFSFSHMPVGGSNFVPGSGGPGEVEKVTVDYTWDIVTPLIRPFFTNGQIHFKVESAMKNEVAFQ
jgi:Flp pilus assembly protein TadG